MRAMSRLDLAAETQHFKRSRLPARAAVNTAATLDLASSTAGMASSSSTAGATAGGSTLRVVTVAFASSEYTTWPCRLESGSGLA